MFCAKCGAQIPADARFCPACGQQQEFVQTPYSYPYGKQRMMRPRNGRVIGGVCMAVANQLGWDVTLVRIILVALVFGAGTGLLAYIVGWIAIPEEPYGLPPGTMPPPPPVA